MSKSLFIIPFLLCSYLGTSQTDDAITDSVGIKLKLIQPGSFKRENNHPVEITKAFYIGVYEVTQSQFEKVMGFNPAKYMNPDCPVVFITWNEAVEFCRKLCQSEAATYRLPTEAEWEYAARAGTEMPFPGDGQGDYAWFRENIDQQPPFKGEINDPGQKAIYEAMKKAIEARAADFQGIRIGRGTPQLVGQKKPNPWGLYDMSGNVAEYCSDWFDRNYFKVSPSKDPQGPPEPPLRDVEGLPKIPWPMKVVRGGCWYSYSAEISSSGRSLTAVDEKNEYIGFRVVREKIMDGVLIASGRNQ